MQLEVKKKTQEDRQLETALKVKNKTEFYHRGVFEAEEL